MSTATATASTSSTRSSAPDVTTYLVVHRALRSGADRLALAASGLDVRDASRCAAIARWSRLYLEELHCHHTIEDAAFFPALVARAPWAKPRIERTDADHAQMDVIIARMEADLDALEHGHGATAAARALAASAGDLADLLAEHLSFEDAEVVPLFVAHFTAAEYEELDKAAMEILGVSKQALFSVPFILAAATPEEFERAWTGAPLPFKVIQLVGRGRYARLTDRAFGASADRAEVA